MDGLSIYSEKIFPGTTRVLGIYLRPLTIGGAFLLNRLNNPLIIDKENAELGLGGLVQALFILSRPWDEAAAQIDRRSRLLRLWAFVIRFGVSERERMSAEATLSRFINDSFKEPYAWEPSGNSKPRRAKSPLTQLLKVRLMRYFYLDRNQALSYPVSEAIHDLLTLADEQGRVELVSEDEDSKFEKLIQMNQAEAGK